MFDAEDQPEEFRTLSREEAAVVKARNPPLSPWRVIVWQIAVVAVVASAAYVLSRKGSVVLSVLWGGACVVIPASLFARGVMSPAALHRPGTAVVGFFVWELLKVGCSVALLFVAPQWVADLSWPALLAGLVITLQVYWVALLYKPRASAG